MTSHQEADEEQIFNHARRISDFDARAEYLDNVCPDDVIRERVEGLLRIHVMTKVRTLPQRCKKRRGIGFQPVVNQWLKRNVITRRCPSPLVKSASTRRMTVSHCNDRLEAYPTRKSIQLQTLLTWVALCMCAAVSSAGTLETIRVDVDGQRRKFNLFTPDSYDPAIPMPLVFGLHGYTADAGTHQLVTGLNPAAEERGVLVVYPQALNNDWYPGHTPGNNIDYLVEVYEATIEHRNVNKEIVGLSGLSQGATMSLTLAAARPDLFSSVVSVAGSRTFTSDDELVPPDVPEVPDRPISRLHVHGTADELATVELTEDG